MRKNCLPHIKQIGKNRYEFRKRMPRDSGHTGEFKRRIRAKDMAALAQAYAGVLSEYEQVCAGEIDRLKIKPSHGAGPSARLVPVLPPSMPKTLADAAHLNRIRAIMEGATGIPFDRFPLTELRREHARATRDRMAGRLKANGERISAGTVFRGMTILNAMINHALLEFNLTDTCRNPFRGLSVDKDVLASDRRDSLPDHVVEGMRGRLSDDLRIIWRLLEGTGCRVAEVTGVRCEDVVVDGDWPHLIIKGHSGRRLKTASSERLVPLVGDALEAAREAVTGVNVSQPSPYLFPRYVRYRGPEAASATLMKHLRGLTSDKRHVVHSLRHRMKDRLRLAGVPKEIQDVILGHASASVGETYGSRFALLRVSAEAIQRRDSAQSVQRREYPGSRRNDLLRQRQGHPDRFSVLAEKLDYPA
ncbi:MAG: site-specific integrase [Paracoccus sp. (in: a-proteobacteria)]|nr:site-specific integrase [Paracoccus sp. (in: a-proteobacteria)]